MKTKEKKDQKIQTKITDKWIYFEYLLGKENINKTQKNEHGKYLFYSDDQSALIEITKIILLKYKLHDAKVSMPNKRKTDKGFSFVSCIYDGFPKLKTELKQFADQKKILYRYWKRDFDTLHGNYSKAYLKSIGIKPHKIQNQKYFPTTNSDEYYDFLEKLDKKGFKYDISSSSPNDATIKYYK